MNARRRKLLLHAAAAIVDGHNPFTREFAVQHLMLSSESYQLAQDIAIAVKGFVRSPVYAQNAITITGLNDDGAVTPDEIWTSTFLAFAGKMGRRP